MHPLDERVRVPRLLIGHRPGTPSTAHPAQGTECTVEHWTTGSQGAPDRREGTSRPKAALWPFLWSLREADGASRRHEEMAHSGRRRQGMGTAYPSLHR